MLQAMPSVCPSGMAVRVLRSPAVLRGNRLWYLTHSTSSAGRERHREREGQEQASRGKLGHPPQVPNPNPCTTRYLPVALQTDSQHAEQRTIKIGSAGLP